MRFREISLGVIAGSIPLWLLQSMGVRTVVLIYAAGAATAALLILLVWVVKKLRS